jgi:hypothetical protein
MSNGGGSGEFTSLIKVKKDGNTITLLLPPDYLIAGGDRCNNGIESASVDKNGLINYSQATTPFTLISEALPSLQLDDDASDGLDDENNCPAATYYSYNLYTNKSFIKYVDLGTNKIGDSDYIDSVSTYQDCFNKLYNSYIDKKETILTPTQLTQFGSDFAQCVAVKK